VSEATDGDRGRVDDATGADEPASEGAPATAADSTSDEDHTAETAAPREHLADVEDGCGCAEVWEHLSEQRAAGDD
jgi:hypothetical protein